MTDEEMDLLCGAVIDPEATKAFMQQLPIQAYSSLTRESGVGKKRFLWQYQRDVLGYDFEEIQTIGDCVGKGIQRVAILLWCVRIALGMREKFPGIPASEVPYALGRHEIGRDKLGKGDGCVVEWSIEASKKYGLLFRKDYGSVDLTDYSGQRARDWGAPKHGLPDELEPLTRAFPILEAAPINSWRDGCDAMYNGEPLVGGSNSIFTKRDGQGYLILTKTGGHCTVFDGYDDTLGKKSYWSYNNASWPKIPGVRIENCPACCGPITRGMVEKMLNQGQWYAVSDIQGMPAQSDDLNSYEML